MTKALTWIIQYQKVLFDDIEIILKGLRDNGQQSKGNINLSGRGKVSDRKSNALKMLEDIDFVDTLNGRTKTYKINKKGLYFLNGVNNPEINEKDILHSSLYENIIHYNYAYDYIIENDFYKFTKEEFIKKLVLQSSKDYGVRIFDWKSGENVLNFMAALNVISKTDNQYSVEDQYKQKFDESKFEKLIREFLGVKKVQETNYLCEYLLENSAQFIRSKGFLNLNSMYKLLLNLNNKKEFLKFMPGLSRPPIPSKHTLIQVK